MARMALYLQTVFVSVIDLNPETTYYLIRWTHVMFAHTAEQRPSSAIIRVDSMHQ